MKPPSSILIFQHDLDFPGPEAVQNFFLSFSETCEIGTFSTQTQLFLKVSKTRIRLIFLKTATGACQIAFKSILDDPPWKISTKDDGFVKFWLNYIGQIGTTKKKGRKSALEKIAFFFYVYDFLGGILFWSRGSVEQFLEFFWKKNLKNGRPGSRQPAPGPAAG